MYNNPHKKSGQSKFATGPVSLNYRYVKLKSYRENVPHISKRANGMKESNILFGH